MQYGKAAVTFETTILSGQTSHYFDRWMRSDLSPRALSIFICNDALLEEHIVPTSGRKKKRFEEQDILTGGPTRSLCDSKVLFERWFSKSAEATVVRAFSLFGLPVPTTRNAVDIDKVNVRFRRLSLQSKFGAQTAENAVDQPDRLDISMAMEVVRAYVTASSGPGRMSAPTDLDSVILKEMNDNPALDTPASLIEDYLISLMKLKNEGLTHIANLQESQIYSVLGLSPSATDAEVKRAYKNLAMQLHPDKGGDKDLFQRLTDAYERIMEQRGASKRCNDEVPESTPADIDTPVPACPITVNPIVEIVKSADACVSEARRTSELVSKAIDLIHRNESPDSPELKALLLMISKSLRICGYSCLDLSSCALDTVKTSHACVEIAGETMNIGFDALKAGTEFAKYESTHHLLDILTNSASRAVACAQAAARLASAVEQAMQAPKAGSPEYTSKASSPKKTAADIHRKNNANILRKLNSDLLEQQAIIREAIKDLPPIDEAWVIEVIDDIVRDALRVTEAQFNKSILLRSVDQILHVFMSELIVFNLRRELAVSTNPLNRFVRFVTEFKPSIVSSSIQTTAVPRLIEMCGSRNKLIPSDQLQEGILRKLDLGRWQVSKRAGHDHQQTRKLLPLL